MTHILNVSADLKPNAEVIKQLPYFHLPLRDDVTENLLEYFPLCIKYIEMVLEDPKAKLLVHWYRFHMKSKKWSIFLPS